MKDLEKLYKEWREVSEGMLADGFKGSVDCGEGAVREDFSNFAELDKEISFEDMLELEKDYEFEKKSEDELIAEYGLKDENEQDLEI